MNKEKITNVIGIIFICCVFVGLLIYMFNVDGINNIIQVLKEVKYNWVIIGLILTVIYWILEGMCFYVITKKIYKDQKFMSSFRLAVIGRLFNNITPFSCGDQPAQLLLMKQEGKSVSNAASILFSRFIVYQIVLVIYTLIILICKYYYFKNMVSNFIYLALIGFLINTFVVVFLIMLAINEKAVYNLVKFFIKIFGKLKIIKDVEPVLVKIKCTLDEFRDQFNTMRNEKAIIFKMSIYTAIEITVLYSITYVVYKAFGQNSVSFMTIISAQTILSLITVYMPTPGAGVAAEGGFYIIFNTFFPSNMINLSILFWRMYTFYLPIIVGTIFLLHRPKINNVLENNIKTNN